MDHMMRQPGDAKNHYHHQHSLCCLRQGKENTYVWWAFKESALNLLQNYYLEKKNKNQKNHNKKYTESEHIAIFVTDFTPLPMWLYFA